MKIDSERDVERWTVYEILFHIGVIITLIVIIVAILIWCGHQLWIVSNLHNQCIADCMRLNAEALKMNSDIRCVC